MRPIDAAVGLSAAGWLGTPYHHQASLRGVGCDCLGLIRGIWRELIGPEPAAMPPYTPDWMEARDRDLLLTVFRQALLPADRYELAVGSVLVFRMAARAAAKHCAIMINPVRMVHARERLGVVSEVVTPAWDRRIVGVFRFPGESV